MKLKYVVMIALALVTGNVTAQKHGQQLIDSLVAALPNLKDDTNKCKALNELAYELSRVNIEEGLKYGQASIKLCEQLKWKKGIAKAYSVTGVNYHSSGDQTNSLKYYTKALEIYNEIKDDAGAAQVMGNLGLVYASHGNYPKALENYLNCLKINERAGNKERMGVVFGNIGILYDEQHEYNTALDYYFRALKIAEDLHSDIDVAGNCCNIAIVYRTLKQYDKALDYFLRSLKAFEQQDELYGVLVVATNIGSTYREKDVPDSAIKYHQRGLALSQKLGDKTNMAANHANLGQDYLDLSTESDSKGGNRLKKGAGGLINKAISELRLSVTANKEIDNPTQLQFAYDNLSKALALAGNYREAYDAYRESVILKDTIFSRDNAKKIVQQQLKYDFGKREDSLKLIHARIEKETALKLERQRNLTLGGVAGMLLLIGFSFFMVRAHNRAETERKRSDSLLLNILPATVATELKTKGETEARHFDDVTVLFTDFVGFTSVSEQLTAKQLVDELHDCFKKFDEIITSYGIEKIKTIGDAYLAVSGLPSPAADHAALVIKAALDIRDFMAQRYQTLGALTFQVRIGVHTGPLVAGIVGVKKFAYDVWGDTVNTAARMEQSSEPGKINISEATYRLVKDQFTFEYRGELPAKNKGLMKMYFVA